MKRFAALRGPVVLTALALLQTPVSASACAMCMGAPDSHNGDALNGAIFLMLGFLALVFTGIIAVVISIARRTRQALPAHAEFSNPFQPQANEPLS